jgi:hypothetical protein
MFVSTNFNNQYVGHSTSSQPMVSTRPSQILMKKFPNVPRHVNRKITKFQLDILYSSRDICLSPRVLFVRSRISGLFQGFQNPNFSAIYWPILLKFLILLLCNMFFWNNIFAEFYLCV